MICLDCATAADWQQAGKDEEVYPHPSECGCFCQHKPAGSVSFLRKENGFSGEGGADR